VEKSEPVYLELVDALELYASIIGGTTGQAADQLRDQAGLESALGRPRNYAHYQEADLALQAAALAHGVAESQAFIDGNKRSALVLMLTFLEINGYEIKATDPELDRPPLSTRTRRDPWGQEGLIPTVVVQVGNSFSTVGRAQSAPASRS
jgi:death-on-curing family protein